VSIQPLSGPGAPPEPSRLSFDQLDTLVRVTTVQSWVYLGTLFCVCLSVVVFAVVYQVPTKVTGEGILLIDSDALALVRSQATGRLVKLSVGLGAEVKPESVVGTVSQDDQIDTINEAKAKLEELKSEDKELTDFEQIEKRTHEAAMARASEATRDALVNSGDALRIADKIVVSAEHLRLQHLLGDLEMLTAREKLYAIQRDLKNSHTRLAELELDRAKAKYARGRAQIDRRLKIKQLETKLALDAKKLERTSRVVSKTGGRVADVLVSPGELVREGAPILLLHSPVSEAGHSDGAEPHDAVVFVPAGEGKKIEVGDLVQVSPATVKREEHGFIKGRVVAVSVLPATKLAMEAALAHPELVESFLQRHAPGVVLRVLVRLDRIDGSTVVRAPEHGPEPKNLFKWSSSSGILQPLKTGTMCQAAIVVERRRLISLLLPWVKTQMGGP
jgi:HlyD family secretion protein